MASDQELTSMWVTNEESVINVGDKLEIGRLYRQYFRSEEIYSRLILSPKCSHVTGNWLSATSRWSHGHKNIDDSLTSIDDEYWLSQDCLKISHQHRRHVTNFSRQQINYARHQHRYGNGSFSLKYKFQKLHHKTDALGKSYSPVPLIPFDWMPDSTKDILKSAPLNCHPIINCYPIEFTIFDNTG